jgi:hypothetical protein
VKRGGPERLYRAVHIDDLRPWTFVGTAVLVLRKEYGAARSRELDDHGRADVDKARRVAVTQRAEGGQESERPATPQGFLLHILRLVFPSAAAAVLAG